MVHAGGVVEGHVCGDVGEVCLSGAKSRKNDCETNVT